MIGLKAVGLYLGLVLVGVLVFDLGSGGGAATPIFGLVSLAAAVAYYVAQKRKLRSRERTGSRA